MRERSLSTGYPSRITSLLDSGGGVGEVAGVAPCWLTSPPPLSSVHSWACFGPMERLAEFVFVFRLFVFVEARKTLEVFR